jgi:hypothetical protein
MTARFYERDVYGETVAGKTVLTQKNVLFFELTGNGAIQFDGIAEERHLKDYASAYNEYLERKKHSDGTETRSTADTRTFRKEAIQLQGPGKEAIPTKTDLLKAAGVEILEGNERVLGPKVAKVDVAPESPKSDIIVPAVKEVSRKALPSKKR